MFKKKSSEEKSKFNLFALLLSPWVKIIGGIFSVLAAVLFGGFHLSRKKKKKVSESEARLVFSQLVIRLVNAKNYLMEYQTWLNEQNKEALDIKEFQVRYAGLKDLYNQWVSHERMEEILGTVQYDPRIGMNISNGLHELRTLNILIETLIRDEKLQTSEGNKQLLSAEEHLVKAIDFFNYIDKYAEDVENNSVNITPIE